ncbi:MAG: hypothetical protein AB7E15_02005 [Azospira sp.]|jgi:hypothetical protein
MFAPEFVRPESGSYVLVANHFVETAKALELSIAFNRARIEYAKTQLPKEIAKCTLVYDIRGQKVPAGAIEKLRSAFSGISELKVMS